VGSLSPEELQRRIGDGRAPVLLFVGTSREFAGGHVTGARWLSRSWLELRVGEVAPDRARPVVVTDADGIDGFLAGATLQELGYADVAALTGGMDAWRAAGRPVEQGLAGVMTPPDDVMVMGPERGYANMVEYLRWEVELGKKYEPGA
jgi:rhodanese-related sulfurtransferase